MTSKTLLLTCDRQRTSLRAEGKSIGYTAHGYRCPCVKGAGSGFNGERLERLTGNYLLGNGHRVYDPALMRFYSPDSWSPFGRGGLNPYAYCLGDPVNLRDPTGRFPIGSLVGVLGLGVNVLTLGALTPLAIVGVILGVAAVAVDVVHQTGARQDDPLLGKVGLVLAGLSAGVGVLGLAKMGLRSSPLRKLRQAGRRVEKVEKLEVVEFHRTVREVRNADELLEMAAQGNFVRMSQLAPP